MLTAEQTRALELARSDQLRAQHLARVEHELKEQLSVSDNANDKLHRQAVALDRAQFDMKMPVVQVFKTAQGARLPSPAKVPSMV